MLGGKDMFWRRALVQACCRPSLGGTASVPSRCHHGAKDFACNSFNNSRVPRLIRPGLGFGSFWTARRTLAGYEMMAMVRTEQVRRIGGRDMRAQATFVAGLFDVAA